MKQIIRHIDDILPAIEGREEFRVIVKDGYTVIDYVFQQPDTFAHPLRRECRGIKFSPSGTILARPLHKFFNIGETEETLPHRLDTLGKPRAALKMDGSMVHPIIIDGDVFLMTRMGRSPQARMAEELLTDHLRAGILQLKTEGWTPIFEFTAPNNRIVVKYDQPELTLLAVRHIEAGAYASRGMIEFTANRLGVRPVEQLDLVHTTTTELLNWVRPLTGIEGYVLIWPDGTWAKAKGDEYVRKHTAKEATELEKNVLEMILRGTLDDIIPLLDQEALARVRTYEAAVHRGITETAERIGLVVNSGADLDQKTFATQHLPNRLPLSMRSIAFTIRARRQPPREAVSDVILKNTGTQTRVDLVRDLFKAKWPE